MAAPVISSRATAPELAHLGLHLRGLAAEHLEDQAGVVGQPARAERHARPPGRRRRRPARGCGRRCPSACSRITLPNTSNAPITPVCRIGRRAGSITQLLGEQRPPVGTRGRRSPATAAWRRSTRPGGGACGPAGRSPSRAASRSGAIVIRVSLSEARAPVRDQRLGQELEVGAVGERDRSASAPRSWRPSRGSWSPTAS